MAIIFWAVVVGVMALAIGYRVRRGGREQVFADDHPVQRSEPEDMPTIPALRVTLTPPTTLPPRTAAPPPPLRRMGAPPIKPDHHWIEYSDMFGEVTERYIIVRRVLYDGEHIHLDAWCDLRQGLRSFRADRILRAYAPDGSLIADPVATFGAIAMNEGEEYSHRLVWLRVKPGVSTLVWAALGDRYLSELEIDQICKFVERRVRLHTGEREYHPEIMRMTIASLRPTKEEVLNSIGRMGVAEAKLVGEWLEKIQEIDASAATRIEQLRGPLRRRAERTGKAS